MNFEDVLSRLCTKLELRNSSDFQQVFAIADEKEARLAYDVLTAYGFECKVYPPEDGHSKLYVTNPVADDSTVASRLSAALAYSGSIAKIKSELDELCKNSNQALQAPEYSIAFVNLPGSGGKQMLINIVPASPQKPVSSQDAIAAVSHKPVFAQPTQQSPATNKPKTLRYARPKQEENMFSGPSLLADNNKIISKKEMESQEADTAWKQFTLYIKGNSAVAFSIIVVILMGMLTIFSMWVVSKGFLCPDLAHNKKNNVAWYCQTDDDDEENGKNGNNTLQQQPPK